MNAKYWTVRALIVNNVGQSTAGCNNVVVTSFLLPFYASGHPRSKGWPLRGRSPSSFFGLQLSVTDCRQQVQFISWHCCVLLVPRRCTDLPKPFSLRGRH